MTTLKTIAAALNRQTKKLKLTRIGLKEKSGIAIQTVVNILSGNADYRMSKFLSVVDQLGLEVVLQPKNSAAPLAACNSSVKSQIQWMLNKQQANQKAKA